MFNYFTGLLFLDVEDIIHYMTFNKVSGSWTLESHNQGTVAACLFIVAGAVIHLAYPYGKYAPS